KPYPGIYIKSIDGETVRRLASGSDPAWSPDGRDIAFVREGPDAGVFVIPQSGGAERKIAGSGNDVKWTPDSRALIIRDKDPDAPERYALFSISLKTLERRQLTHAPTGLGDWEFAAATDGRTLAFV